jgi:hypothetical protein
MKKNIFFRVGLLCLFLSVCKETLGQNYITLPINGSVFQQNIAGNATVYFTAYDKESYSESKIFYRIYDTVTNTYVVNLTAFTKTFPNTNTTPNTTGLKGFISSQSLPKGWYRLDYIHKWKFLGIIDCIDVCDKREFGVGDVYFAAGQSNASGYNESDDNLINYSTDIVDNQGDNKMVRAMQIGIDRSGTTPNNPNAQTPISRGLPYGNEEFKQLTRDASPIYPNGVSSWCWAPLGNKFANETN